MKNTEDQQDQLDSWDPDKAKVRGTFKAPLEIKTGHIDVEIPIDFGEPKPAETVSKKAKIVNIGKRNKNALF